MDIFYNSVVHEELYLLPVEPMSSACPVLPKILLNVLLANVFV